MIGAALGPGPASPDPGPGAAGGMAADHPRAIAHT